MIEFKKLCKQYRIKHRTIPALKSINLTINQGEIFGIFGESGAGKSTLLRMVNFLEQPTDGQVIVDGVDLASLNQSELRKTRRKIGMIFQHFNLLQSRTAFENIALPLELENKRSDEIQKTVKRLLKLVNLERHADHYPNQLSGGQKQRVAIARALTTNPAILLCDEPTSALDAKSTQSVLSLLKEINKTIGVTILLITHEMDVIKQICDRAGVLDNGSLVEYDTVLALFAKPKASITAQLVQKSLHIDLPPLIKNNLQREPDAIKSRLVRFTFVGDDSGKPLITTLVQKFNITINILQANIEIIQDQTIGFTLCQLSGDHQAIDAALDYLAPTSVSAEVLGYV